MSGSNVDKHYCLNRYNYKGKEFFEVVVQKRDKNGRMIKKRRRFSSKGIRISSLKIADQVRFQLKKELESIIGQKSNFTWSQWQLKAIESMRKDGYKESTIKNYDSSLSRWKNPNWDNKELSQFDKDDIYEFIHEYLVDKNASDWNRKNVLKRIKKLFEMAVDSGEIDKNPARGIRVHVKKSEGIALTPGEVKTLLDKGRLVNHVFYPHWVLALMTGMRNGELFALRWTDIDLESGLIYVNKQFTSKDGVHYPKNGESRPVDISSELRTFLIDFKNKNGVFSQKLWKWSSDLVNKPLNDNKSNEHKDFFEWDDLVLPRLRSWRLGNQARELKKFCKEIDIRPVKFHDLRATHITNLLSNGVAISKVMKQVGHALMSTTDGYHRLTGVHVKGISDELGFSLNIDDKPDNVIDLFAKKGS